MIVKTYVGVAVRVHNCTRTATPTCSSVPFDSKMIVAETDRMTGVDNDEDDFFPFIDTIALAKQMVSLRSYKLSALLDHVGLHNPQSHAAIADATATGQMLNKLFGREAAKIARQILDQAEPFNAAHTTGWGLPCKPTVTRG